MAFQSSTFHNLNALIRHLLPSDAPLYSQSIYLNILVGVMICECLKACAMLHTKSRAELLRDPHRALVDYLLTFLVSMTLL